MRKSGASQAVLAAVVASHAVDHFFLGLMPLLYPAIAAEFSLTYSEVGLLATAAMITMAFLQLAMGYVHRHVSGSVTLGLGKVFQALMNMLASLSLSFGQLLIYRLLAGAGSSPQHPVGSSMISEHYGAERRGRALGLNISGANIGWVVAPLTASFVITSVGWRLTLLLLSIPSLVVGAAIILLLKEPRRRLPETKKLDNPLRKELINTLRDRRVIAVCVVMVVIAFQFGMMSFVPVYLVDGLGMAVPEAGVLFTVMLTGSVVGPTLWGYLSDRFQRRVVVIVVMGFSGFLTYLLPFSGDFTWLIVDLFLVGLMFQTLGGVIQASLADVTDPASRSTVFGFFFTLGYGVGSFAPAIFGFITDIFSFNAAFTYIALVSALAIFPALYISETRK